jgi:hypothetical protein
MTLASLGAGIQALPLFSAVRESRLVYPILLATHLASIATFGGLVLATNLRLLGLFLVDIPSADLVRALRPWKQFGFGVMITAGVLLGGSKAAEYLTNPFFQTKMLLLFGVGLHGWFFRRRVYRTSAPVPVAMARAAGVLSIVLWIGVLSMGRWIAYYDRPEPPNRTNVTERLLIQVFQDKNLPGRFRDRHIKPPG